MGLEMSYHQIINDKRQDNLICQKASTTERVEILIFWKLYISVELV